MPATNPRYQVSHLEQDNTSLKIVWQDEHISHYPAIWLLEACNCVQCGDTQTAVRHTKMTDKPSHPRLNNCSYDDSSISVDWGDAHFSSYDLTWLRTMFLSDQARQESKFKPLLWGSEMATALPYMNYAEVCASSELHRAFLESILYRGMAPVDCARDQVEPFYDALREFLGLSFGGQGMIEFKLQSGEVLVFNNQRLMHGRTAFDSAKSKRHIRSGSVDLDEFYSRLRIIYDEHQNPRRWMTFRKG